MAETSNRTKSGRFVKGRSGNPKGRPPLPPEYKAAIETIGTAALAALDRIVAERAHPRHEQAVEYAINRWKGMPRAHQQLSTPAGAPLAVTVTTKPAKPTTAELRAELAAKMARFGALPAVPAPAAVSDDDDAGADG